MMILLDYLSLVSALAPNGNPSDLMEAVKNGMTIVGIGTIGYAVINKAKEGDIWSAVTTGVLGALALAFVVSDGFRNSLMGIVESLMKGTFGDKQISN